MSLGSGLPRKRSDVRQLRTDDECVLCDSEGRVLCAVNETASALWELCDGRTRPAEIVDAICIACSVDREIAEFDVQRALRDFTSAGLIEWSEE